MNTRNIIIDDNLIGKLTQYQIKLTDLKDYIEERKNNLQNNEAVEEIKIKMLRLVKDSLILLEDFF
jgi:hypothetical protein